MEKVIEKYNKYIENYRSVWENRFTWRDRRGDKKPTTNIVEFFKDTKVFDGIKHTNTLEEMFKQSDILAGKYEKWVLKKSFEVGSPYSETDLKDMHNFFNGAIGEFFIVCLLTEIKSIDKYDEVSKMVRRYDFTCVSPLLPEDDDIGVDLTCVANDKPSVIQVKWWNKFGDDKKVKMNMDVFHKLISVGLVKEYCRLDEKDNRFLFWTGKESKSTKIIRRMNYQNWCTDFGDLSIGAVVDKRVDIHFWDVFYEKLSEFSKI